MLIEGLSVAEKTIEKFLARAVRLYEQELREPSSSPQLGLYVRRWVRWVRSITCGNVDLFFKPPPQSYKPNQPRTKKEQSGGFGHGGCAVNLEGLGTGGSRSVITG